MQTFRSPYKPRLLNLKLALGRRALRSVNSDLDTSIQSNAESVWSGCYHLASFQGITVEQNYFF